MKRKIIEPVAPKGMDIVLMYPCPNCQKELAVNAPIRPVKLTCPFCSVEFPILPADPTSMAYIKLIFANGAAIINPDFA